MAIPTTQPSPVTRQVKTSQNLESTAWRWMRYSGFLLIPLAWGHILIQDVIVGVHNINEAYVAQRFLFTGWRIYDILLLAFAFAHGMNGLRQVLSDLFPAPRARQWLGWILLVGWAIISVIGAIAIIAFQAGQ